MNLKLQKTLLNKKLSRESVIMGFMSLFFLLFMFSLKEEKLMANGDLVFKQGQYWRAWTSAFVHADYRHLASNTVYFSILATLLNNYFGNLLYPILSFVMAGVINLIVMAFYPSHIFLVGISGVVYFMAGMWLTFFLLVERTLPWPKRLIIVTGLGLIFLAPEIVLKENVSYLAHAVGFLLGVPTAILFFKIYKSEIRAEEVWIEKRPDPEWVKEWDEINALMNENPASPEHWHQTPDNCR